MVKDKIHYFFIIQKHNINKSIIAPKTLKAVLKNDHEKNTKIKSKNFITINTNIINEKYSTNNNEHQIYSI